MATKPKLAPVEKISFRTNKPQLWRDPWRNTERLLEYMGQCVGCGSRTYSFEDGENDPRGVLGERHASSVLSSDSAQGLSEEHHACFSCMNDEPRYRFAIAAAQRIEKKRAAKATRLRLMSTLATAPYTPPEPPALRFALSVDMSNLAFAEFATGHHELVRILRETADKLEAMGSRSRAEAPVRDSNGNTVGRWSVE